MAGAITIPPIDENVFRLIAEDWMLITAGEPTDWNTMTASWGGVGIMWNRPVCWCMVRPQRHTFDYLEDREHFCLSFFAPEWRTALELCGTRSGRDCDKGAETGLRAVASPVPGAIMIAQARMNVVCRKAYWHDLDPGHFLDPSIGECYPAHDYHRVYVGEILAVTGPSAGEREG